MAGSYTPRPVNANRKPAPNEKACDFPIRADGVSCRRGRSQTTLFDPSASPHFSPARYCGVRRQWRVPRDLRPVGLAARASPAFRQPGPFGGSPWWRRSSDAGCGFTSPLGPPGRRSRMVMAAVPPPAPDSPTWDPSSRLTETGAESVRGRGVAEAAAKSSGARFAHWLGAGREPSEDSRTLASRSRYR